MGIRNVFKKKRSYTHLFSLIVFWRSRTRVENKLSDLSILIPNYFFNNSLQGFCKIATLVLEGELRIQPNSQLLAADKK